MGMGNRIDPSKIVITTLDKTNNDPLAKKIRNIIKDTKLMHKINVVCSTELPFKTDKIISSMMPVPSTAGIYMAYFVLNDILKK
jgi:tRNA A37 threonylcarbamoyladenosine dehydratase